MPYMFLFFVRLTWKPHSLLLLEPKLQGGNDSPRLRTMFSFRKKIQELLFGVSLHFCQLNSHSHIFETSPTSLQIHLKLHPENFILFQICINWNFHIHPVKKKKKNHTYLKILDQWTKIICQLIWSQTTVPLDVGSAFC